MTARAQSRGAEVALRVLANVERLPEGATGALMFGRPNRVSGAVLVENGRVCWAAASGLRQRLSDLLRDSAHLPLSEQEVTQLFLSCRAERKPLGEAFLQRGWLSPEALRSALLRHTAESLSVVPSWASAPRWVPHRASGYASAFTFLPGELLCFTSAAVRSDAAVRAATGELREMGGARNAAVFDWPSEVLLACQLPEPGPNPLGELRAAGAWQAASLSDAGTSPGVAKFTVDPRGTSWVAWRGDHLTYLVRCGSSHDFSALARSLARRGWTSLIRSQLPLPTVEPLSGGGGT